MPSNLLNADTSFPQLNDEQSEEEKITLVVNYLYMLLEQLRYTLSNLGEKNFNQTELQNMADIITGPVYIELNDGKTKLSAIEQTATGLISRVSSTEASIDAVTGRVTSVESNVSTLEQTATSITARVSSAEANMDDVTGRVASMESNVSTLEQTANSITARVSSTETSIDAVTGRVVNVESNMSTLEQTATSITTRVSSTEASMDAVTGRVTNVESAVSTLQQTANSITARVSTSEGRISTLQQTANSITTRVANAEGDISTLEQTVKGFTLSVTNGSGFSTLSLKSGSTTIATSGNITLGGNVVFKNNLTDGSTQISGSNIKTGTISAERIDAENIKTKYLWNESSQKVIDASTRGTVRIGSSTTGDAVDFYVVSKVSRFGSGNDYVEINTGKSEVTPGMSWKLGTSTRRWESGYFSNLRTHNLYADASGAIIELGGFPTSSKIGFFGATPITRRAVADNATVATLITALKAYGLIGSG